MLKTTYHLAVSTTGMFVNLIIENIWNKLQRLNETIKTSHEISDEKGGLIKIF